MNRLSSALLVLPVVLMGVCTALAQPANAPPASPAGAVCPDATDLTAPHLYGLWRLALWPEGGSEQAPVSTGAMLLGPHPEYNDSVRGRLRRSGPGADLEAEVAGDVGDDGTFGLDESTDGQTMDAVWVGQPLDCGRSIRGQRHPAEGRRDTAGPPLQFLLQRAPGFR